MFTVMPSVLVYVTALHQISTLAYLLLPSVRPNFKTDNHGNSAIFALCWVLMLSGLNFGLSWKP